MKENVAISGKLQFLNMGEILQLLGNSGATGTLRLTSRYSENAARVYVVGGNPIHAEWGSHKGLDAAYRLFGWSEGFFEFVIEEVSAPRRIEKKRMELILDALRMLDEGKIEKLGPVSFQKSDRGKRESDRQLPLIRGPLVDYMHVVDEESYFSGEEIVGEGKHGTWLWVILEGEVEVAKQTDRGPVALLHLGDGAFVGTIAALLSSKHARSASAIAIENVQLGMLDSQRLIGELSQLEPETRNLLLNIDKRLRLVTEQAVHYYQNDDTLRKMLGQMKPLLKQGANEKRLFTIRQGHAMIVQRIDRAYLPLAVLEKGDFFGHIPFLDIGHEPYGASIFASEDLKLSAVELGPIQQEFEGLSSTLKNILTNMATSISVTTRMAGDFFSSHVGGATAGPARKSFPPGN